MPHGRPLPLPETDLFIHIQLTPVLRIVRITHLHSPCRCFGGQTLQSGFAQREWKYAKKFEQLRVKKSQQLNSNPMSRQQIQNLFPAIPVP